jgi:hypothetical protein
LIEEIPVEGSDSSQLHRSRGRPSSPPTSSIEVCDNIWCEVISKNNEKREKKRKKTREERDERRNVRREIRKERDERYENREN